MDADEIAGEIAGVLVDRGFFFIRGFDGVQYFAHKSSLQNRVRIDQIRVGDRCQFLPTHPTKGPRAESIVVHRLADDNDPLAEIGL